MFWLLRCNNSEHDETREAQPNKKCLAPPLLSSSDHTCIISNTLNHFFIWFNISLSSLSQKQTNLTAHKSACIFNHMSDQFKLVSVCTIFTQGDVPALPGGVFNMLLSWRHMHCCEIAPPPPSWLTHPWCVYTHTNTDMSQHMSAEEKEKCTLNAAEKHACRAPARYKTKSKEP